MPTYDYKCEAGHLLSVKYSITETTPPDVTCPDGCKFRAKRIFNSPVIEFKGEGFYATDKKRSTNE